MKAKYYKGIAALAVACTLFFSSCLKDSRYTNFAASGYLIEIPKAGLSNFSADALTEPNDTITLQMAVNLASPNPLKTDLVVTLGFSQAMLTAYNAANPAIAYLPFPTGSYVFTNTSVTIPAGQRTVIVPITFYKSFLDPSKSYLLPLAILGTNNSAVTINALYPAHYYHFIGNPFAGTYTWNFTRYNAATATGTPTGASFTGQTAVLSPVSPTQFEVVSGYYTQLVHYEVTFSQPDATHFNNFQISMNSSDIANDWTPNGISLTAGPTFGYGTAYDPTQTYTFAQAISFFTFSYQVTTSSPRFLIDQYIHP